MQHVVGEQFDATVAKSFRGNKTQIAVSYSSRSAVVDPEQIALFSENVKRLSRNTS